VRPRGPYDDTSDGPVSATVVLNDGTTVQVVDNAWVLVAPPKFAPAALAKARAMVTRLGAMKPSKPRQRHRRIWGMGVVH